LRYTHFPGVRHRPTRPPLQFNSAKKLLPVIYLYRGAKVQNKFTHHALKDFYSENVLPVSEKSEKYFILIEE